ncbi:MAG TPA: hypothetical protein VNP04_18655 [Alphaproteobacteria bacterium]|nr:hypothetical protein [Alphaproteobacteria bacterium]
MSESTFDAQAYKETQRHEWGQSAAGWKQYWQIWERGAQCVNDRLVELAAIQPGYRVLDIASGLGEPALTAARKVGAGGKVDLPPPPAGVPGPFSLADEQILREHFQRAGFTHIHTEHLTVTLEYISPEIFIEERLATSANTRLLLAEAAEAERVDIFAAIREELQTYKGVDGLIRLRNDLLCIVGW